MSAEKILELPILPYVKKFVMKEWENEKYPYRCAQNNQRGRELRSLVVRDFSPENLNPSDETIQLQLSSSLWKHRKEIENAAQDNILFLDIFKTALFFTVNVERKYLGSRNKSFFSFKTDYGITEQELSDETIERMFHWRSGSSTRFSKRRKGQEYIHLISTIDELKKKNNYLLGRLHAIEELVQVKEFV